MALLEALAAGKFVVGPATGGAGEILQAPVEGALIEEGDSSRLLRRLQELPAGFDSPINRQYAQRFDIREYAKKMVSLYEELTERRH